jgi:cell division protease FtsH
MGVFMKDYSKRYLFILLAIFFVGIQPVCARADLLPGTVVNFSNYVSQKTSDAYHAIGSIISKICGNQANMSINNAVNMSTMTLKNYTGYAPQGVADLIKQIRHSEDYVKMNVELTKGIIFFGPPGSGKTHLARSIAEEVDCPFFAVNAADFKQHLVGLGKDAVVKLFLDARIAARGHISKKAIIFIDEFDAVGTRHNSAHDEGTSEVINALLNEMDGFNKYNDIHIVVIAATNFLERIDSALQRSGRFDYKIYVSYPDQKGREQFIRNFLNKYPSSPDISVVRLAQATEGMSPADLVLLFNFAGRVAVDTNRKERDAFCFEQALRQMKINKR